DSTLLNVQATTLLQNAATLQANILAWNDTYLLTRRSPPGPLVWVFWRFNSLTTDCPYRERLQQYSQMYQSQIGDSTLLNVQATTLLQNAAT
ncbi:hypothetical protein C7D74_32025, partial [Klebsiella pneumoniae]